LYVWIAALYISSNWSPSHLLPNISHILRNAGKVRVFHPNWSRLLSTCRSCPRTISAYTNCKSWILWLDQVCAHLSSNCSFSNSHQSLAFCDTSPSSNFSWRRGTDQDLAFHLIECRPQYLTFMRDLSYKISFRRPNRTLPTYPSRSLNKNIDSRFRISR
jgi:hypothetical protein